MSTPLGERRGSIARDAAAEDVAMGAGALFKKGAAQYRGSKNRGNFPRFSLFTSQGYPRVVA